jgi:hypothetical protein
MGALGPAGHEFPTWPQLRDQAAGTVRTLQNPHGAGAHGLAHKGRLERLAQAPGQLGRLELRAYRLCTPIEADAAPQLGEPRQHVDEQRRQRQELGSARTGGKKAPVRQHGRVRPQQRHRPSLGDGGGRTAQPRLARRRPQPLGGNGAR